MSDTRISQEDRARRLAEALRANLRRRKAQGRARRTGQDHAEATAEPGSATEADESGS